MQTVTQRTVKAAGLGPLPPHPSEHMTPEQYAGWVALFDQACAERGLPPEPWPLP